MVALHDLFSLAEFEEVVEKGYVRVQRHPEYLDDVAIANYTPKAQHDRAWNDVTEQCRGLIYNPTTEEVIARPFRKFFNHDEQYADVIMWDEHVTVFDKLDGSLGIPYPIPGTDYTEWGIATRGSFTSEQAVWATNYYRENRNEFAFVDNKTDLFEIIYPENRIVVNYTGMKALVYLGSVSVDTGKFEFDNKIYEHKAEILHEGALQYAYELEDRAGKEGFVICAADGVRRVKVKQDEYVRLHRTLSNLNRNMVWETMHGPRIKQAKRLAATVPEEHGKWVMKVANEILAVYDCVVRDVYEAYDRVCMLDTRKQKALMLKDESAIVRSAVFAMLDDKSFESIVWKYVKTSMNEEGESANDD